MDGNGLAKVSLEDKYTAASGRVFLSGVQAMVRLPIMQRERDRAQGLNTAGFISGYRGSPLGGYDGALWQAAAHLREHDILFQPGLNEDLAATAVWGTQQLDFVPGRKVDGVFGIWYGKGPGVDRSGDPFKHANYAGTHPNGGVLLVYGDDHPGKSSTIAHQSDQALAANNIPVLYPANVQELLDLGLHGIAMSRFAGTLTGFKTVNETIIATETASVDPDRVSITLPDDAPMPEGGVHIRMEYDPIGQDQRLARFKLPRAQAYARANKLDGVRFGADRPTRLGIVTAGKAYLDTVAGLRSLGIDDAAAKARGIGVYKVAMIWPLEPAGLRTFAAECDELMFVEEKRSFMEEQARAILYDMPDHPRITGKTDSAGNPLLPIDNQIEAATVADKVAERMQACDLMDDDCEARWTRLRSRIGRNLPGIGDSAVRSPYFCSGCPHNTSTKTPDGSMAMGGIGCHGMAVLVPERRTMLGTHMGGEGITWTGMAPFTETGHIFQNLGDGTYTHSGSLAVRAAVQSGANITYKILYNDAAAMTGGQPVEGGLSVVEIAGQMHAEGIKALAIVSDRPEKFRGLCDLPAGARVYHRDELDAVQRRMRDIAGTTVIVYEQTCAAEKRRRRKRGAFPDPNKRAFINTLICEGCGDCSSKANCVSIHPVETTFGRKRKIDQSSCNKDYSCIKGFCPAFVTVEGGDLRRPNVAELPAGVFDDLPEPGGSALDKEWAMLVAGIGGTGVVTISAVLGMAAHLEGKGVSIFDMTGLSQKNGAVYSHLKIAAAPGVEISHGVGLGEADLLLGCDLVAAVAPSALHVVEPDQTQAVVNANVTPTPAFQLARDLSVDGSLLVQALTDHVGAGHAHTVDATRIALALTGDTIGANSFMIGFALQRGCLPLSVAAIEEAIAVNGVAVPFNLLAFRLGRLTAAEPEAVTALMADATENSVAETFEETVARRVDYLTDYQDAGYASRYRDLVEMAQHAESKLGSDRTDFAAAVARYAFKLMAYKDEYEVARLHRDRGFAEQLKQTFSGDYSIRYHLAPPFFSRRNPHTGLQRKSDYGPWMAGLMKLLAGMKGLRGGRFDPFGWTAERRTERRLRDQYITDIETISAMLSVDSLATAISLAEIPEHIRGFGYVKDEAINTAASERERLLAELEKTSSHARAA